MEKRIISAIFIIIAMAQSFCFASSEKSGDVSDHIYLELELPKNNVVVNEELLFSVKLFSDWLDLENISLQQKPSENLIVRKFSDKIISNTEKNGVKYVILEYKSSLCAVIPGTYQLNPVEATLEVVMPEEETGPRAELLNDNKEFYDKFIGSARSRTLALKTPAFTLIANEIPAENRPDDLQVLKEPRPKAEKILTIVPLKESYGPLGRYNIRFYRNKIFILFAIIPVLAVLAASLIRKRIEFLAANPLYAAMLRASKKARARIVKAEGLLAKGRASEFYSMIFNIMQVYLGERAIIPEAGVTAKILDSMANFGLGPDICEKIKKIFSECYMAKYTSIDLGLEDMKKTLEEVKYIIDELDKKEFKS